MHKELEFLGNSISNPIRPVAAVIGGLKVSTKMDIIYHLMEKIDKLLIGGAMIFTFFAALGHNVGDSYVEKSSIENALNIIRSAVGKNVILRFASDVVTVPTTVFKARHPKKFSHFNDDPEQELPLLCCKYDEIKKDWAGVDIGSQTIADFEMELSSCRTVIMNGKPVHSQLISLTRSSAMYFRTNGDV